jgi:integrase
VSFKRLLEKAGLRDKGVHDLRYSFASLLPQQGESVVYVKDQLGHASIHLTVDTYGHLIPGANRAAVDRVDDVSTDPSASQAHPERGDTSTGDRSESFVVVSQTGIEPA